MNTKHYAVIGHPIGHTMSPFIHKRLFELSGIDADYGIIDIAPENLATVYAEKLKKLDGYNITSRILFRCLTRLTTRLRCTAASTRFLTATELQRALQPTPTAL